MHKKISFLVFAFVLLFSLPAFPQTRGAALYQRAQSFLRSGDYANAILVLNQAVELAPESALYKQQLAYAYSLNNNLDEAEKTIKDVLRSNAANVQTYQIAGNIYKAKRDLRGAERNFKRGLRKFPNSGDLYSELGQVYYAEREYTDALSSWVKGIEVDPDYAPNYYYAARTYYYSNDKFWAVIYGELFINLERFTNRTSEMKKILLASYKALFNNNAFLEIQPTLTKNSYSSLDTPDFKKAFLNTLAKSANTLIARGITPETLVMMRTRFILYWDNFYKFIYPYALFNYYQQLLKNGLFEAYNQWIFGPAADPAAYKAWVRNHQDVMHQLIDYLNNHSLQPRESQFYQKEKVVFEPASMPQ